jgi:hypothetical protein
VDEPRTEQGLEYQLNGCAEMIGRRCQLAGNIPVVLDEMGWLPRGQPGNCHADILPVDDSITAMYKNPC